LVYVSLDDMRVEATSFGLRSLMDISVIGFVPKDHREAVGFLTKVFERLRFDYLSVPRGKVLLANLKLISALKST